MSCRKRQTNFYTFNGQKLRKTVENNGTISKVDYCGSFIYETVSGTRSLKYILTPHGRAVKSGSTWVYNYNITDHLGNVRAEITPYIGGAPLVTQSRNYYTFGMEMSQLNNGTTENKYQYNGKELQDDFGLYWYDYGARFYDPMLGKWQTPDPHAENYYSWSPYHYAANNPLVTTDPTGMDWYQEIDKDGRVVSGGATKWREGSGAIEGYTNVGASVNIQLGEGYYYNAFQNYGITSLEGPIDVKQKILGSASLQGKLLSEGSGFSAQGQADIMASLIGKGQSDFINHPLTQATISGLMFVATGGIEGAASLLNAGRSLLARSIAAKGGTQGGLNLFKWGAEQTGKSTGWKAGDYMLHLPNKGTPALNWKANYGALRSEMNLGKPIFDSYRLPNGNLIPTGGFLNAERYILQSRGWMYNPGGGAWMPPIR